MIHSEDILRRSLFLQQFRFLCFSSEALFSVLNAFSMPKFIYSRAMKKFTEYLSRDWSSHNQLFFFRKDIDNDLFGNARTRSEVFWERYDLLLQVK
jgi:hypothetical protein